MNKQYQKIWRLALPYLKSGVRKDFISHTRGVVKAVTMIMKKSGLGDERLLLPAAILHDTGWSMVPKFLQLSEDKKDKIRALELHLEFAPAIIGKILGQVGCENGKINKIIEIVKAHKFKNPRDINKRILIDADALSDAFKKQFESDLKSYKVNRKSLYNFRKKDNEFYYKVSEKIFNNEIEKRK